MKRSILSGDKQALVDKVAEELQVDRGCGDLLPDNGARERVVEYCPVDNYHFYPYLSESLPAHEFYAEVLAVLRPEATRCRCVLRTACLSLRAPPRA